MLSTISVTTLIYCSISKVKGSWPKLAVTCSPGVRRPIAGKTGLSSMMSLKAIPKCRPFFV